MKTYCLGLNTNDDINFVLEVFAENIKAATVEWARLTGHDGELFEQDKLTYFGWPIVETTMPALKRKSFYNPFQM